MARYPQGQAVRLGGGGYPITVKDSTGALTNATSTTVTLQQPSGSTVTYSSPTNESTGLYHLDLTQSDITTIGHYQWSWDANVSGSHAITVGAFDVYDPLEVTILSLADAKQELNIPLSDTSQDDELFGKIATATSLIERATGGPIVTRTITSERTRAGNGYRTLTVRQRPLVSVTSIVDVVTGTAVDLSDIELDTVAGVIRRKRELAFWSYGPFYLITYTAGWGTTVHPDFNQAARFTLRDLWSSQRAAVPSPFGVGPQSQQVFTPQPTMGELPEDAYKVLRPYLQEAYF